MEQSVKRELELALSWKSGPRGSEGGHHNDHVRRTRETIPRALQLGKSFRRARKRCPNPENV
eukprot:2796243-Rhodomonas_salina.1